MPAVGQLRERITIQQEVRSSDGMGGGGVTWNDVDTVWAKVSPLRGVERTQANQQQGEVMYRITMRYRTDIKTDMRIAWGSVMFNITSVYSPDMRSRFLTLDVTEGAAI